MSALKIEQFGLGDTVLRQRYDALFEACPNAYIQQSTLWAEAIKDLGPDEPIFLLAHVDGQDLAGLPLYLYRQPTGNVLTSVPQPGPMGGVFVRDEVDAGKKREFYSALLQRAEAMAREHQCLSLTFITDPFTNDVGLYEELLKPTYVFENFTQSIPLKEVIADGKFTLKDYNKRSNLSRNVKKSHEAGFEVQTTTSKEVLHEWYPIHVARHTEIGASPLRLDLFENILAVLGPKEKAHLLIIRKGGEIASGCLYIHHRNILDVFLLSMNTKYFEQAPNFLNTEQSMLWAAGKGMLQYNWQSSPRRDSGVYRYKTQWGSKDIPYYFVTKLLVDAKVVAGIGLDTVKQKYPFHYVVPFAAFSEGFDKQRFQKCPPLAPQQ